MSESPIHIEYVFDEKDHWTLRCEKRINVVLHDSVDSAVAAFYDITIEELYEDPDVEHSCTGITIHEQLAIANAQPAWGWCSRGRDGIAVIHVWYDKSLSYETAVLEVCEVLAHEHGHLTGRACKSYDAEEKRAQGYGCAAVLATKMAADIVIGTAYAGTSTPDLVAEIKAALMCIESDGASAVQAHSDSMIAMLHELRNRTSAT